LGTTNQNLIRKEIKKRFNSGKAYYHSVQKILSSRLLSRNIKIRIHEGYNFVCSSVWARNLVSDIKGEQGANGNGFTEEIRSDKRLEKRA
jgi:hypothetical protein